MGIKKYRPGQEIDDKAKMVAKSISESNLAKFLGTILLITATLVFGCLIPSIDDEIHEVEGHLSEVNEKIELSMQHFRDFKMEEVLGINIRNTLAILERVGSKSVQYQELSNELQIVKVNALIYFAAASNEFVGNEVTSKWKSMSFDDLENEKLRYVGKFQEFFDSLIGERKKTEDKKLILLNRKRRITFYIVICQVLGLFLINLPVPIRGRKIYQEV